MRNNFPNKDTTGIYCESLKYTFWTKTPGLRSLFRLTGDQMKTKIHSENTEVKQVHHLGTEFKEKIRKNPTVLKTPVGAVLQLSGRRYFKRAGRCLEKCVLPKFLCKWAKAMWARLQRSQRSVRRIYKIRTENWMKAQKSRISNVPHNTHL